LGDIGLGAAGFGLEAGDGEINIVVGVVVGELYELGISGDSINELLINEAVLNEGETVRAGVG